MNEYQIRKIVDDEINKNKFLLSQASTHTHSGSNNVRISQDNVIPTIAAMGKIKFKRQITYTLNFTSGRPNSISFNGFALPISSENSITFSSGLSRGATFGTLTSAWGGSTEALTITFSDGELRTGFFTSGSLTVSWIPGLSNSVTSSATYASSSQLAMIVGNAVIGQTNYFQPNNTTSATTGGLTYPLNSGLPGVGTELAQNCSYLYQDTTNLANTTFGVDQFNIISAFSPSGTVAVGTLTNPTISSIDLNMRVLASGWEVVGNFTLS